MCSTNSSASASSPCLPNGDAEGIQLVAWGGEGISNSYQPDSIENIHNFLPLDWLTVFTDGLASRWSGGPRGRGTWARSLCPTTSGSPISQAVSSQGRPGVPEGLASEDNVS